MSITLKEIQQPISGTLQEFETQFKDLMRSNVFLLDKVMNYIVKRKGKQIRPMFVFITAEICGGVKTPTYRGAALIELLHTATLVHDDVVDDSNYRRGFFSVNALWKNKIAVLVGDYLLSRGLLLSVENKDFRLLEIVSFAVKQMSEGELLQIEKARKLDITEEIYFDVIRKKTASLIASCCAVGASSAGAEEDVIEQARAFGELVGIAFQIKDDLFDYGEKEIGKPLGIDIKERKMTLPLIYALNNSTWLEKQKIIYIIKNQNTDSKKVAEVIEFVKAKGGLDYSIKRMEEYYDRALQTLNELPGGDSSDKEQMRKLVSFVIERNK